ncbi:MAG: MipA/OmpV family protein, partial [Candidatus Electrothrix sp. MAN1_4]|nr:MipA/OmpV family protein [Candidatus Electrothrix sp. MAN1_4]
PQHLPSTFLIICIIFSALFFNTFLSFAAEAPSQSERAAPTLSLGGGIVCSTNLYQGASNTSIPIPLLMFSGEQFFIRGTGGGMHISQKSPFSIDLLAKYRFDAYETGDSAELVGIKERKGTVEAGIKASLRLDPVILSAQVLTDILDEHRGQIINLRVMKPFRWRMIFLAPYLGASLLSDDFSTYYYGVDNTEALAGYSPYELDWTINAQAGLTCRVGLSQNIMLNTALGLEILDQDIADSPIVDQDTQFFGMLGIAYGF